MVGCSLFERDRKICLPCAVNRRVRPSPHALMEHLAPATPSAKSRFLGLSARCSATAGGSEDGLAVSLLARLRFALPAEPLSHQRSGSH